MTAAWRLPLALGLAVITIALFGYAVYSLQAKQSEIDDLRAEIAQSKDDAQDKEMRVYDTLLSPAALAVLDRMVAEPDQNTRSGLVFEISKLVFNDPVAYGAGEEIWGRIDMLVRAQDQAERQDIRTRLEQKITDMMPVPPPSASMGLEQARSISTLVTAVLGLGSGLGSLFVFMTGGKRRRIEEEMLTLDLEKSRLELARLRFDTREALEHQQMP